MSEHTARELIKRCAKIAEPWPGFWLDENSTDVDRAVVAVRTEIAEKIRALSPSDLGTKDSCCAVLKKALEEIALKGKTSWGRESLVRLAEEALATLAARKMDK